MNKNLSSLKKLLFAGAPLAVTLLIMLYPTIDLMVSNLTPSTNIKSDILVLFYCLVASIVHTIVFAYTFYKVSNSFISGRLKDFESNMIDILDNIKKDYEQSFDACNKTNKTYINDCCFTIKQLSQQCVEDVKAIASKNEKSLHDMKSMQTYKEKCGDWFYDHSKLKKFESSITDGERCEEIWVISRKLLYEKPGGLFRPTIVENLEKGVVYKYIIPKFSEFEARDLKKGFNVTNADIQVETISDESFDYPSDVIIYVRKDPIPNENTHEVFMELLISNNCEGNSWVKIHASQVGKIVDCVERDINSNVEKLPELVD